jgi:Fur family peroxide stress response transcriptional regulator
MLELAVHLKEKNLKVTPQRLAIYHLLFHTDTHPSAEMIYTSLRDVYPTLSLATVYKTLDTLVKNNLIQQINVGEDAFRYDAVITPHSHIICTHCHQIYDTELPDLDRLRQYVAAQKNFEISHEQVYFYGLCPNCKHD